MAHLGPLCDITFHFFLTQLNTSYVGHFCYFVSVNKVAFVHVVIVFRLDEENTHQRTLFTRKQKEANRDFTR